MGPGLGWKTLEHVQGIRHMGSWYVSLKGTRRLLCSAFLAYHSDLLNNSTSWFSFILPVSSETSWDSGGHPVIEDLG